MSEFSDRLFAAGSLFGLRAFRVDDLGRLTGVTHKDVWTPGVNEAVCHKGEMASGGWIIPTHLHAALTAYVSSGSLTFNVPSVNNPAPAPDPTKATEPPYVQLTQGGRKRRRKDQKSYTVSDKPQPPAKPAPEPAEPEPKPHNFVGIDCSCGFYAYFDGGNDYLHESYGGYSGGSAATNRIAAVIEAWGRVVVGSRGFRAEKAQIRALVIPASASDARQEIRLDKVRRNYPLIPVFAREGDAIREFPLTDPDPITPETVDDFWTRSVS